MSLLHRLDQRFNNDTLDTEEPKEKTTFNLPIKLLEELEDKWMEVRRRTHCKQISKTLIVEEALRMAFQQFELTEVC